MYPGPQLCGLPQMASLASCSRWGSVLNWSPVLGLLSCLCNLSLLVPLSPSLSCTLTLCRLQGFSLFAPALVSRLCTLLYNASFSKFAWLYMLFWLLLPTHNVPGSFWVPDAEVGSAVCSFGTSSSSCGLCPPVLHGVIVDNILSGFCPSCTQPSRRTEDRVVLIALQTANLAHVGSLLPGTSIRIVRSRVGFPSYFTSCGKCLCALFLSIRVCVTFCSQVILWFMWRPSRLPPCFSLYLVSITTPCLPLVSDE